MEELLIGIIESLGYPMFRQGSLGVDTVYPESFFTFWNNNSNGSEFYDNKENSIIWDFDLNFYSSNPSLINSVLIKAKEELLKNNFIVHGRGYDVLSDEITHIGRGINVKIIEK